MRLFTRDVLKKRNSALHKTIAKAEVVKNMLKLNLSNEIILKSTGLSIKEIEKNKRIMIN